MTWLHLPAMLSHPSPCKNLALEDRGRRECRVFWPHPQPRTQSKKAYECSHRELRRRHPAFPARLVLTVYSTLSPAIGLSCHRRLQHHRVANLISASRYQDHVASPSAAWSFVFRHAASTASAPDVQ